MWAAAYKPAAAVAAIVRDESGEGFAQYSVVLGFFVVQCICGAIALNHRVDDIIHTILAVF